MAITSIGYDTPMDEAQFEKIIGYSAHSQYGVNAPGAFAASTITGQVLKVRIAPGTAWTSGTVDIMDAEDSVTLAPVSSGSRWDMIVLRRDYQPEGGGPTRLAVIKGNSTMTLPGRNTNAGVLDDQPLWLVRVDKDKAVPSQYVDLRVWARNSGCTANHDLVRSYLSSTGTMIEINGVLWLLRNGANNQNEWVKPVEMALAGDVTSKRLRLTATNDATPTSKDHAFQVGPDNGPNVIMDGNEILARNNGKAANLYFKGGASSGAAPTSDSHLTRRDYVDEMVDSMLDVMPKTISGNVTITPKADTPTSVNVRFPVDSKWFSRTPNVVATPDTVVIGDTVKGVSVDEVTRTGFRLWIHRTNNTPTKVYWIAT